MINLSLLINTIATPGNDQWLCMICGSVSESALQNETGLNLDLVNLYCDVAELNLDLIQIHFSADSPS